MIKSEIMSSVLSAVKDWSPKSVVGTYIDRARNIIKDKEYWESLVQVPGTTTFTASDEHTGLSPSIDPMKPLIYVTCGGNRKLIGEITLDRLFNEGLDATKTAAKAYYYARDGLSANGAMRLRWYPIPTSAYTLHYCGYQKPEKWADYASGDDVYPADWTEMTIHAATALIMENFEDDRADAEWMKFDRAYKDARKRNVRLLSRRLQRRSYDRGDENWRTYD